MIKQERLLHCAVTTPALIGNLSDVKLRHPVHLLHDGLLRIAENALIRNPGLMCLISLLPDPFSSDPEKRHTSLPFVPPSSVPVFGQQKKAFTLRS